MPPWTDVFPNNEHGSCANGWMQHIAMLRWTYKLQARYSKDWPAKLSEACALQLLLPIQAFSTREMHRNATTQIVNDPMKGIPKHQPALNATDINRFWGGNSTSHLPVSWRSTNSNEVRVHQGQQQSKPSKLEQKQREANNYIFSLFYYFIYLFIYLSIYVCIYLYMYLYMYLFIYVFIYLYLHKRNYIYMFLYIIYSIIYIYIWYMYIIYLLCTIKNILLYIYVIICNII